MDELADVAPGAEGWVEEESNVLRYEDLTDPDDERLGEQDEFEEVGFVMTESAPLAQDELARTDDLLSPTEPVGELAERAELATSLLFHVRHPEILHADAPDLIEDWRRIRSLVSEAIAAPDDMLQRLDRSEDLPHGAAGKDAPSKRQAPQRITAPARSTANNYIALINGINNHVQNWKNPGALDVRPSAEHDLLPAHREMLVNLRSALVLGQTSWGSALTLWEQISPRLDTELRRAGRAGLIAENLSSSGKQLAYLRDSIFRPGAYREAKRHALEWTNLPSPDIPYQKEKLKRAEAEFNLARQLLADTRALGSGLAQQDPRVKTALEIAKIVALPGDIEQKLEYARKHGTAVTAADLRQQGARRREVVGRRLGHHRPGDLHGQARGGGRSGRGQARRADGRPREEVQGVGNVGGAHRQDGHLPRAPRPWDQIRALRG
jgi:hypothetical protein